MCKILLIAIGGILIYKFLLNLYFFIRCKIIYKRYTEWLFSKDNKHNIFYYQKEVETLFKRAGVDGNVPVAQEMGYGQIAFGNPSLSSLFPTRVEDYAITMAQTFSKAAGEYKRRFLRIFNPLYLLEFVFMWPRELFAAAENTNIRKLLGYVFSAVWWIAAFLLNMFSDEIKSLIGKMFGKFF